MSGNPTFAEESAHFWGRPLTGRFRHYCCEFDDLPIDETCSEFACCTCYDDDEARKFSEERRVEIDNMMKKDDAELLKDPVP